MKRRNMRRDDANVRFILERKYAERPFADECCSGVAGLIEMLKVSEPVVAGGLKIIDVGYAWLQFAFRDKNYWLTVLFDDTDSIVEYYFDITAGNYFDEDGGPWFYDSFLDVVMTPAPDGKIILLDEDELEDALAKGLIDGDLHALAKSTADALIKQIEGREADLRAFVMKYYRELKGG